MRAENVNKNELLADDDRVIARLPKKLLLLPMLSLLLLWPALLNGAPFIFPDTTTYVRSIDALVVRATGWRTAWSNADVERVSHLNDTNGVPARKYEGPIIAPTRPILAGRSAYYGVLTYTGAATGSLWSVIIIQATLAGCLILGAVRHLVKPEDGGRFVVSVIGFNLALATTPLAFFASMVMPDFFTGVAIIAAAMLLLGWQKENPLGRLFWFLMLTFAMLTHSSHLLIVACLALVCVLAKIISKSTFPRHALFAFIGAIIIAACGEIAFSGTVRAVTGQAPMRPPFITARLVADGPGVDYLRAQCPTAEYVLCKYADRLPLPSDDFLWRADRGGVFMAIPGPDQRALANEQMRFVFDVVRAQPVGVAQSTAQAIWNQFGLWGLSEFDQSHPDARAMAQRLPSAEQVAFVRSAAYSGSLPVKPFAVWAGLWAIAGLLVTAAMIVTRFRKGKTILLFSLMTAGWIFDVVICGALSTPHDRYQARVIWILDLIAFIAICGAWLGKYTLQQKHSEAPMYSRQSKSMR